MQKVQGKETLNKSFSMGAHNRPYGDSVNMHKKKKGEYA